MRIEQWPIDRPKPYEKNARKWKKQAIEKVAASIREFGWRQPIVCDAADVIVIGHLRLAAAKHLGLKEVPVHVASDLTSEQIKALRLADNRVHEEADWDSSLLAGEMLDLSSLRMDLAFTGFDGCEIERFLAPSADDDEKANACPDLPEAPVSALGDLWLLGQHRVLCGDSTASEGVSRLLSPTSGIRPPRLMVTDPPYGVEYDPEWRNDAVQAGSGKGAPGGRATGKVSNDDRADWHEAWALFPGSVAYVWHSAVHCSEVALSLLAEKFEIRAQIIWAKSHIAISRGAYHWQHEPCWYAVRKGQTAEWRGDRKQTTLWEIPKPQKSETGHGTQKPVECMRRPILNHTKRGEAVYDPFLGSGTTLIAAESTKRICYGIEIDPKYVDVIVQRWQEFTGKEAVQGRHIRARQGRASTSSGRCDQGRRAPHSRGARERCRMSPQQLHLAFDRGLPVALSPLALKRAVCRHLRAFDNDAARGGFELRQHLEEVATLEQIREAAREQARELKREARQQGRRMKGRATIAYVCTTEGRRALRLIERLSERIGTRESGLCA